jgi:hypothetical protein
MVRIRINVKTACYSQAKPILRLHPQALTPSGNPFSGPISTSHRRSNPSSCQGTYVLLPKQLSSKAAPSKGSIISSAPPRQGIIHADQARLVRHHSCIGERKGYDRGLIPRLRLPKELRNSCGARQGKVKSCLRQSCFDKLVYFLRFMRRERAATKGEIRL